MAATAVTADQQTLEVLQDIARSEPEPYDGREAWLTARSTEGFLPQRQPTADWKREWAGILTDEDAGWRQRASHRIATGSRPAMQAEIKRVAEVLAKQLNGEIGKTDWTGNLPTVEIQFGEEAVELKVEVL